MGDAVGWITANWGTLIVTGLAISGAFAQIAHLTPWGWDDDASGFIEKVFAFIAGNSGTAKGQ
jgi:hypothetical protein